MDIFLVLFLVHRRSHHDVHHRARTHADGRHRGVVARLVKVKVVAGRCQQAGSSACRHVGIDVMVEVLHYFFALPAEVQHLTDAGMYGAVAHHEDHVAIVKLKLADEHALVVDVQLLTREITGVAVMVPDSLRVVKLEEVSPTLVVDVDDGECTVCHTTLFADR